MVRPFGEGIGHEKRHQTTGNVEAVHPVQIIIRLDRGELEYQIEGRLRSSRLRVVEHNWHLCPRNPISLPHSPSNSN